LKLIRKISRVSIASELFYSGDGILLSNITVDLGENQRTSSCSFSVYDKDLEIGAKFQRISLQSGGILVPDDLLKDPDKGKPEPTGGTDSSDTTLQSGGGGNIEANIQLIVNECIKQGVTDQHQIAYILATAQHESNFEPVTEIGGSSKEYAPYQGRGFRSAYLA
jgi:hypothetical protein